MPQPSQMPIVSDPTLPFLRISGDVNQEGLKVWALAMEGICAIRSPDQVDRLLRLISVAKIDVPGLNGGTLHLSVQDVDALSEVLEFYVEVLRDCMEKASDAHWDVAVGISMPPSAPLLQSNKMAPT